MGAYAPTGFTIMKINGFTFSKGNSKIGLIWNFSLPPIKACPKGVPCATSNGCYAHKAYRIYPGTRKAWDSNLKEVKKSSFNFYKAVCQLLAVQCIKHIDTPVPYFRIHVAGDFIDQDYLMAWQDVARANPKTRFLAFTKQYNFDYSNCPKNMKIIFSMWPGYAWLLEDGMRRAWLYDPHWVDHRIPKKVFKCKDSCETCKYCWNGKGDVVFMKH